jgi:hypothetical protein
MPTELEITAAVRKIVNYWSYKVEEGSLGIVEAAVAAFDSVQALNNALVRLALR